MNSAAPCYCKHCKSWLPLLGTVEEILRTLPTYHIPLPKDEAGEEEIERDAHYMDSSDVTFHIACSRDDKIFQRADGLGQLRSNESPPQLSFHHKTNHSLHLPSQNIDGMGTLSHSVYDNNLALFCIRHLRIFGYGGLLRAWSLGWAAYGYTEQLFWESSALPSLCPRWEKSRPKGCRRVALNS